MMHNIPCIASLGNEHWNEACIKNVHQKWGFMFKTCIHYKQVINYVMLRVIEIVEVVFLKVGYRYRKKFLKCLVVNICFIL
jgi:hypothetical protein